MSTAANARYSGFSIGVMAVVLVTLATACIAVDPYGPRSCECDLLKEWVGALPILPGGAAIEEGITVSETEDHFTLVARGPALNIDEQHKAAIINAFESQGLQHEIRSDTADEWSAVFYPGSSSDRIGSDTPWRLSMAYTTGLSLNIVVKVDGVRYGIDDIDELWETYDDDRQAALDIQERRQEDAIALLEPIQKAANSLARHS